MAATYDLISEQVLSSAASSVTFSNIPQGFKDLVLEIILPPQPSTGTVQLRFNGDANPNYSLTAIFGNGSTATSARLSSRDDAYAAYGINATTGNMAFQTSIFSYANALIFKSVLTRVTDLVNGIVDARVSLWRSTSAITSISISSNSGQYQSGAAFRLWGVVG